MLKAGQVQQLYQIPSFWQQQHCWFALTWHKNRGRLKSNMTSLPQWHTLYKHEWNQQITFLRFRQIRCHFYMTNTTFNKLIIKDEQLYVFQAQRKSQICIYKTQVVFFYSRIFKMFWSLVMSTKEQEFSVATKTLTFKQMPLCLMGNWVTYSDCCELGYL